jgi:hypothetical protein
MSEIFDDPVVAEIHAVRAAMLEAAGGDADLMMRQVAERQRRSTHRIITEPFRKRTEGNVNNETTKSVASGE